MRDSPADNSVFVSSNCRVISAIISKVIVGRYVFVRWYEIILFSLMSAWSLEPSQEGLNFVSTMLNCESVLDPLNVKMSGIIAMLPSRFPGSMI